MTSDKKRAERIAWLLGLRHDAIDLIYLDASVMVKRFETRERELERLLNGGGF